MEFTRKNLHPAVIATVLSSSYSKKWRLGTCGSWEEGGCHGRGSGVCLVSCLLLHLLGENHLFQLVCKRDLPSIYAECFPTLVLVRLGLVGKVGYTVGLEVAQAAAADL